jgi:hypothetical protein
LSFAGISNELKAEGLSTLAKDAISSVIAKGKKAVVSLRKLTD